MSKTKAKTDCYVLHYRRRLVNIANSLNTLCKIPVEYPEIPLICHNLLKDAMKQVIRAYKKIPDK